MDLGPVRPGGLRRHARALAAALAVAGTAFGFGLTAPLASAEFASKKVAYVIDNTLFSGCTPACGVNDTSSPPSGGSSIFHNAVTGETTKGAEGEYTPEGGETVTLKTVTLAELDANPHLLEEGGFDTAILYETCSIGTHPAALAQVNAFLEAAHKVMIFDADACSPTEKGQPNWSGFIFPFATNNPGPEGAEGPYTAIEPSTLTAGLSLGVQELDAVGDANIFTTPSLQWFQAVAATNIHGVNGTVLAYSRSKSGGLALYSGEDFWFTDAADPHLKRVFDNMLNQHWNPDKLPSSVFACTTCGSTVTTRLSSTVVPAGTAITDSATVVGVSPAGTATGTMTFTIYSDPHCQLPVAGQAQRVPVATGGATTAPIALPAGTYYFQAQYSGDPNNEGGISQCGTEVLTVAPINPPIEKHPPRVLEGGELEWEVEFPEPGEAEYEVEVLEGAELASSHVASAVDARHHKGCKQGFVKKHGKCVHKGPVTYGKAKIAVPAAGIQKLRIKPSAQVLKALKKGKRLNVRLRLVFTPALTTVHITKTASVKLILKKKQHRKHHGHKK